MPQFDLRTYRRRSVTRESGYHTCDETTGGECILQYTESLILTESETELCFYRESISLSKLFNKNMSLLSFGGFVYGTDKFFISIDCSFDYEGKKYHYENLNAKNIDELTWSNLGFHKEINLNQSMTIENCYVRLKICSSKGTTIHFCCFDFNSINKPEFLDETFATTFYQKTNLHIPYLYYLETTNSIAKYLTSSHDFNKGFLVVLKSCNRCGRFLLINSFNEMKTIGFSLHCKKKAPCKHTTFRAYKILNIDEFNDSELKQFNIENDYIVSYYGHQLECKACKKFFVNAPLNPQRNAQQFKEDGLRRRAIEVLVNELLNKNLVHFEFEKRTKKEFSKHIWNKFNKKCFKCGKELQLEDMALDHTMPLAYLYRLDESATCLCSSHNAQKSDHFPIDFYSEKELLELSKITGLDSATLHSKSINNEVLQLLKNNVVWFYDDFLMRPDYQKIRDGIKTADKINDSLKRVISGELDLAEEYKKIKGFYPKSITIV